MVTMPEALEVLRENVDPQEIALQYIHHEFIKLFRDQPASFYEQLADSVNKLPQTIGVKPVWELLAGLSEGYKLKWTYRILTDDGLQWRLEKLALDDIRMSGMSPFLNGVIAAADRKPSTFAKLWKAHPEYAKNPEIISMEPHPERDNLPIMIHEKPSGLQPFDGMRRTCMAAIAGKTEITAWVGRRVKPGKQMLNPDKPLFMFATYKESSAKGPHDIEALIGVSKMFAREYRNGEAAVERGLEIWDYSEKPELVADAARVRAAIQSMKSTPSPAPDRP